MAPVRPGRPRLAGRVGTVDEERGDAEILSEPLGGQQWVKRHSGSFPVKRGDWVVFHRDDDVLAIWKQGAQFSELLDRASLSGAENHEKLAQLYRLNQAQSRAIGALEEFSSASEALGRRTSEPNQVLLGNSSPRDGIWTPEKIRSEFGVSQTDFQLKFQSYVLALKLSGKSSNWNEDLDEFARRKELLTEDEIRAATTDFNQAVLNRVKVAFAMERGA